MQCSFTAPDIARFSFSVLGLSRSQPFSKISVSLFLLELLSDLFCTRLVQPVAPRVYWPYASVSHLDNLKFSFLVWGVVTNYVAGGRVESSPFEQPLSVFSLMSKRRARGSET